MIMVYTPPAGLLLYAPSGPRMKSARKKEKTMIRKKEGYHAPGRDGIKSAVARLLPFVPRETIESLDFMPLYSINSEIECYGLDPEGVAETNIPGFRGSRQGGKEAVKEFRRALKAQLAEAARRVRDAARAKEHAARERERAARIKARAR